MCWKLYLDKSGFPDDASWSLTRSAVEAIELISRRGYPSAMSLGYDLGPGQPTGLEFLEQLADNVLRGWPDLRFPAMPFKCHSNDIAGRCRILGFWQFFQNKLSKGGAARQCLASESRDTVVCFSMQNE